MPVTFNVAAHDANPVAIYPSKTVEDFLKASCYNQLQWSTGGEMLQTSVAESSLPMLKRQKNGFVHTVVEAYGQHHHLRIR